MTDIPGYVAGKWDIDPVHSEVAFTVRHMMVSKVRGRFDKFEGMIVTGEDPADSSVTVSVDANSIDTNNEQRDGHIRSADFFEAGTYMLTAAYGGNADYSGSASPSRTLKVRK